MARDLGYKLAPKPQKGAFLDENCFESHLTFSFADRIRILFGARTHVETTVWSQWRIGERDSQMCFLIEPPKLEQAARLGFRPLMQFILEWLRYSEPEFPEDIQHGT